MGVSSLPGDQQHGTPEKEVAVACPHLQTMPINNDSHRTWEVGLAAGGTATPLHLPTSEAADNAPMFYSTLSTPCYEILATKKEANTNLSINTSIDISVLVLFYSFFCSAFILLLAFLYFTNCLLLGMN